MQVSVRATTISQHSNSDSVGVGFEAQLECPKLLLQERILEVARVYTCCVCGLIVFFVEAPRGAI